MTCTLLLTHCNLFVYSFQVMYLQMLIMWNHVSVCVCEIWEWLLFIDIGNNTTNILYFIRTKHIQYMLQMILQQKTMPFLSLYHISPAMVVFWHWPACCRSKRWRNSSYCRSRRDSPTGAPLRWCCYTSAPAEVTSSIMPSLLLLCLTPPPKFRSVDW